MSMLNIHWARAVANMNERETIHHDSSNGDGDVCTKSLSRFLKDEWITKKNRKRSDWKHWKLFGHTTDVPLQPNGKLSQNAMMND